MGSEQQRGVLSLVLLAWVFASMGIFARYLSTDFALFEQTYLRIGLAGVLGAILFSRQISWRKFGAIPRRDVAVLVFRSIALYSAVVLVTEAYLNSTYSNVSFVAAVPMLPVLGFVLLGERLRARTLMYIVLGFIGVLCIVFNEWKTFTFGYGEMLALCSAVAFNLSYVSRRWQSGYFTNQETTVSMFAIGAVFLLVSSFMAGESLPTVGQFTPLVLAALVGAALFNLANLFLTNYGFQRVKMGVAGNILTLESVFALAYSVMLYGEIPGLRELIGGALIIFSVVQINREGDEV